MYIVKGGSYNQKCTNCSQVRMASMCLHSMHTLYLCDYRFEEEFTVRKVLGQGGFGVVFHVKSKFDHGDYALKLTKLPAE